MPRGRGLTASREIRAFVYGLIQGVGGVEYAPREIAQLVLDRFGFRISPKTISNWKTDLPAEMQNYGISEHEIKEVIARGLMGDLRKKGEIAEDNRAEKQSKSEDDEDHREDIYREGTAGEGRETGEKDIVPAAMDENMAKMVTKLESQGFIVTTGLTEMKDILEAKGYQVIDSKQGLFGIEKIFIQPIELDIEVVGRSIIANPIIQLYYALARRKQEDLDLTAWITACIVELYNTMQPPVKLMVAFG